jgi:hypothetical protein
VVGILRQPGIKKTGGDLTDPVRYIKVKTSQVDRVTARLGGRKVRAPPGRTPGNTREGRPYGKRNRNIPPFRRLRRVKGKGEMVG